jgi:cob(I)alamin adenosyltransferase
MKFKIFKEGAHDITYLLDYSKIKKGSFIIKLLGTIDELNSYVGMAKSFLQENSVNNNKINEVIGVLTTIQTHLFYIGSDVGQGKNIKWTYIKKEDINWLEDNIDRFYIKKINFFIYPGGSKPSSILHVCRSISRVVEEDLAEIQDLSLDSLYMNRLSDLLFVLALYVNDLLDIKEERVIFEREKTPIEKL